MLSSDPTVSRRSLLKGGGASVLAGAAPLAAVTLFQIAYAEWEALRDANDAAREAFVAARAHFVEPPLPPFRLGADRGISMAGPVVNGRHPALCEPSDRNMEELRSIISAPISGDPIVADWERGEIPKARATLAKIEAYQAERDRAREAAGLPALEKASIEAWRAFDAKSEQLLAMKPANLREWAMQARVAQAAGEDTDEWLGRLIEAIEAA